MADWRSMEPAAAQSWVPGDFQMAAGWTMEPAAQVWVPGLPVEYQMSFLASSGQQQLVVECAAEAAAAAATEEDQLDNEVEHTIIHDEVAVKIHDDAIDVFEGAAQVFDSNIKKMGVKMHRYPISLKQYLDVRHSVPSTVAIGPYHHGLLDLQEAEKVKHVAAYHCIKQSGHSVQDMYDAVVLDTDYARSLYDMEVADISDDDFRPMMFYDACFLVQYMLSCTLDGYANMDKSLRSYFDANDEAIFNDVMMLENQLPWKVVETLMKFSDVSLEAVASYARGYLQNRVELNRPAEPVTLDDNYKPPHLLGFLRFYMVGGGRKSDINDNGTKQSKLPESVSFSVSAIELAEMGIEIKARETGDLKDIGIEEGQHNLFLQQVSLDDSRACVLFNMAAFELCTIPDFLGDGVMEEDSAVCSYLQLLAMILDKKEDVQELRRKYVLQGGGGLTDQQVLYFFNRLQDMRDGSRYIRTMVEIQKYKQNNKPRVWWKYFYYKNRATMVKVGSGIVALASIIGTIASFKV